MKEKRIFETSFEAEGSCNRCGNEKLANIVNYISDVSYPELLINGSDWPNCLEKSFDLCAGTCDTCEITIPANIYFSIYFSIPANIDFLLCTFFTLFLKQKRNFFLLSNDHYLIHTFFFFREQKIENN